MKKGDPIEINGIRFIYLKERLMGGSLYSSEDRSLYLRVNNEPDIQSELNITNELFSRGFPVPKIVTSGKLEDGRSYLIETSIGDKVFLDIFAEETQRSGHASDESFDRLIHLMKKYCSIQFNPKNYVKSSKNELEIMMNLENVLRNNPPSLEMKESFTEAYKKASERILSLPWGYVQADLNVFNILPEGIIDFELSRFGPVGYDVITNVYFSKMWPKNRIMYRFTNDQIMRYVSEIDKVANEYNLPRMSEYVDDFLVIKNIWGTGKDKVSEENPDSDKDFWRWRINVRDWCICQYLNGEKIDTDLFEEVGSKLKV
jgi:hypothetical protein